MTSDEARRASDDLAMIRRMMEETRRVVQGGGGHFVLWGVLMTAALLATYAEVALGWPVRSAWVWPGALVVGWIASVVIGRGEYLKSPVSTSTARLLGAIWVGVGVTATILGLVGAATGAVRPGSLSGVMACILAAGYFASGFLYGAAWVGALAVAWWLGGIGMLIWPGEHTLLVFAGLLLVLQVAPGVVLLRGARAARAAG